MSDIIGKLDGRPVKETVAHEFRRTHDLCWIQGHLYQLCYDGWDQNQFWLKVPMMNLDEIETADTKK